jgi:hypothetical protein
VKLGADVAAEGRGTGELIAAFDGAADVLANGVPAAGLLGDDRTEDDGAE